MVWPTGRKARAKTCDCPKTLLDWAAGRVTCPTLARACEAWQDFGGKRSNKAHMPTQAWDIPPVRNEAKDGNSGQSGACSSTDGGTNLRVFQSCWKTLRIEKTFWSKIQREVFSRVHSMLGHDFYAGSVDVHRGDGWLLRDVQSFPGQLRASLLWGEPSADRSGRPPRLDPFSACLSAGVAGRSSHSGHGARARRRIIPACAGRPPARSTTGTIESATPRLAMPREIRQGNAAAGRAILTLKSRARTAPRQISRKGAEALRPKENEEG